MPTSDFNKDIGQDIEEALREFRELEKSGTKLIEYFGASPIQKLEKRPEFRGFHSGLLASHRDFDAFYLRVLSGEKSAIVSGLNASGLFHLGHVGVFDTNLFFQKVHGLDVYAPISDDESYVANKIKSQKEGLHNALLLARQFLAFGFDHKKTHFIIDQLYTNIYNLAIKLSKGINVSTIRAIYDYKDADNIGLFFYPSVQSAHILFPQTLGMKNVLVPIGPDEDTHLRACRDVAGKFGFEKPAVLHSRFLPGIDGKKMSKSKGNAIFLFEDEKTIKKKINSAFSGGRSTIEEHRKLGGVPEIDVAYMYLKYLMYDTKESEELYNDYKQGKLLSGEVKKLLLEEVLERVAKLKERYENVKPKELANAIMCNDDIDMLDILEKNNVFQ